MVRGLALLLFALVVGAIWASPTVIPAHRIRLPPTIDGIVDDKVEWNGVPCLNGLVDETTNRPAPDEASFWIGYDSSYIYVAARLADSSPGQIRAAQYQTNVNLNSDDIIIVDLDLTGTGQDYNSFQVNPRGATNIQLAGGRATKREWAGEFQAAGRITKTGWEVEMRIPWRCLKLPAAGVRDARVDFERVIARSGHLFGAAAHQRGNDLDIPIWKGVEIPKVTVDRVVRLLPYGYSGFDPSAGSVFNSGIDVKTALGDRVQAVGSINPDFRNVEDQILSLDFSRLPRLPGESRPFFLEGNQYVGSPLFASQLTPAFDAGLNLYGKLDDRTSFGLIDTNRIGKQNDLVASGTYAPDAFSSYRLSATSLEEPSVHNQAYYGSAWHEFGGWTVTATDAESADSSSGRGESSRFQVLYRSEGLVTFAGLTRATPNYKPGLAFLPEVNYEGYRAGLYYVRPWDRGVWNGAGFGFTNVVLDHADGSDYRRDANYSAFGTLRNGLNVALNEDLAQFEGSDDHLTTVYTSYPSSDPNNQVAASYGLGREAGLSYRSLTVSGSRRLFDRLQLSARYQAVSLGGFQDQAVLGLNVDLRHDMAVYGRLVKQGSSINGYLAFRRSGNLGPEYYLIVGDPNALKFRPSVILKVVVPIEVR